MADWERELIRNFFGPPKAWLAMGAGLLLFILAYASYAMGGPPVVCLIVLFIGAMVVIIAMTYLKGVWISETWDSLRKKRRD